MARGLRKKPGIEFHFSHRYNELSAVGCDSIITDSSFNGLVKLAISPDGKTLYGANYASGVVSVISTASNTVTGTVTVGIAEAMQTASRLRQMAARSMLLC